VTKLMRRSLESSKLSMAKNKALDVRNIGRQALVTKLMRRLESSKLSMAKNKAIDVRGAGEALEIYHGRP
jgi:hypothetical protein